MDDALRPVNSDRRQSVSIELILPWEIRLPVVTDFVTLHSIVGNGLAIDDRAPAGECRAGRLWTLGTIEIELPCGWAGREWPCHRRPCSRW